ncbi:MAG: hypothetical protein EOP51_12865 [Sphingobacteriales bacterium]|nr:MAG: hypothetical protein EOP51_12865 [Sphingobacteriales bacterium]
MIKILYIGRHAEILETVVRLLNANEEWFGIGAATDEEALQLFSKYDFSLVLLGCRIEEESEHLLLTAFRNLKPDIVIVQHYGGGSGLLRNEITSALEVG